jgi:hypothetical protein
MTTFAPGTPAFARQASIGVRKSKRRGPRSGAEIDAAASAAPTAQWAHVQAEKFHPVRNATLGYEFLKDWFDLRADRNRRPKDADARGRRLWQHALRASDIDK